MQIDSTESELRRIAWVIPHTLTDTLHASARLGPARALQQLGWDVTLVAVGNGSTSDSKASDSKSSDSTVTDLNVHHIATSPLKPLRLLLFHLQACRYLIRHWREFEIIFFQQVSGLWLLPLALFRLVKSSNAPLIVMDTRDFIDVASNPKIWLRRQVAKLAYDTMGRWTDGQTAITERMAKLANIAPQHLWGVWPSGVQVESFAPAQRMHQWPTDEEAVQLVYIGILLPKRHLLELCHAVEAANQAGMNFQLTLVGKGRERARLQQFAERTNGRIQLVDPVPHAQVPAVLGRAHVGVTSLPTPDDQKYEASSPIKLFEYMAAGLPLLATTNACHTDVVQDGQYAFWIEAATEKAIVDALRLLWARRAELPTLSQAAAAAAEQWSWQAAGHKLHRALSYGLAQRGAVGNRQEPQLS